ncbi:MAG TPA: cyclic nucleotide-binding domain-containing protein [Trueperaceae bacterium]|nr:cyclic nucleotide-binding domain-containing protein [Trueperaceae bacterium]
MSQSFSGTDLVDVRGHQAGEVVLFPGGPEYLYRVRSGLVRIHMVDDEGNGLTLRYVKPGGFFGEEALTGEARRYFAEAVTDTEIDVLEADTLDREQGREVLVHLVEVVEGLYRALNRLAGKRLRSRIAAELLELGTSDLASLDDQDVRVVHITHDELAAAVGSVRETVTKVVGELVRMGAIDAGYGKIRLTAMDTLRQVAGE